MFTTSVHITLNGDPLDVPGPVTVAALLESLEIDARKVAVEHNLSFSSAPPSTRHSCAKATT
jgi:sulfur carrier protein ThiS